MEQKMTAQGRVQSPGEEGYILVAVIFLLFVFTLTLSIAIPKISKEIQRDREWETFHRGKQYQRAIQLYYRKMGAYPPSIDALVKTNSIRFLRKKYTDPTTGKDEWKLVRFGQNKTPTAMGFFGQAMSGSTLAGTGASGGTTGSLFGSGSMGSTTSDANSATDSSTTASTTSTTSTTGSTTSSTGLNGQTFGGGGIIGVSPNSPKQSILVYKKKNHYNEWEFTYDPMQDKKTLSDNTGSIGQSASSMASASNGSSSTSSTTTNSTSTGTGSGSGTTDSGTPSQ